MTTYIKIKPHYYNEIDKYAAQWLRNLIAENLIAPGDVDERSIADVAPADLVGYTQCHFFAGIGGWSLAARLAGWPDDRELWTGSCPCQPFSQAGRQKGQDDARHLWPVWFRLIRERRPDAVFGEQVEAAVGHGWLDLVQDDLEAEGYAFAPVSLPAASVGAFHLRARVWFVAHDGCRGREVASEYSSSRPESVVGQTGVAGMCGVPSWLADTAGQRHVGIDSLLRTSSFGGRTEAVFEVAGGCEPRDVAHHHHQGLEGRIVLRERGDELTTRSSRVAGGFWSDAEWLPCRDGKSRPVEPGTFPLAHGVPDRVGRLRAYGNAIVPQLAAEVIAAYVDCRPDA